MNRANRPEYSGVNQTKKLTSFHDLRARLPGLEGCDGNDATLREGCTQCKILVYVQILGYLPAS